MSGIDPAQLDDDDEDDTPAGAAETPGAAMAQPVRRRRYVPPSSVGFSFFVRSDVRLRITASAARYRRVGERDESGRFRKREYKREPFECAMIWPDGQCETPDGVGLDVRRRPYRDGGILTVVFSNRQTVARGIHDRAETCLFEAYVECAIETGDLAEYPRVDPDLLTEEERELELQYRHTHIYAVGHGAAANWSVQPGKSLRIWSEFMPAVDVPRVTVDVRDVDEDVLVVQELVGALDDDAFNRLDTFVDSYEEWAGEQRAEAATFVSASEQATASRICDRIDAARKRMRRGVALLRGDAKAAFAFRLANRAMLDQMRQWDRAGGNDRDAREYRWRPFQLAFLLAVIESAIREHDDFRDILDLIWFPTGGGKTEAYLGLIAFLIVWRRLHYQTSGGGTVVLMRYTLRLLTRQQFERATRIICALELLRRADVKRLGEEPITVGLWVGGAVSPNTFRQAAQCVDDMAPEGSAQQDSVSGGDDSAAQQLVLHACPWCNEPFIAPHSYRTGPAEFAFLCRNPACEFADGHFLPCNVVDEALYEEPPTLLIGTIDKFARLAWEERAAGFFGSGRSSRPPELVIQDELHLIAGPLGSVAGMYEAALETVLLQHGVRPKYIASTATIRMAREQVERLYGRDLAVFPPPGLSADDSWFARADDSRPGRLYVGYLAPALDQQHCLAPLAAALLMAPLVVFKDQQDRDDLLEAWWTHVIYHGSLRGVGSSHNAYVTDVRDFARRLHAEQRQAASDGRESEAPGASGADAKPEIVGARTQPAIAQITSQCTAQENARTFDRLGVRRCEPNSLDAVLATNMISVGVDVDRLATIVINGQPLTTAEYIQASSRIGRAGTPGLVFANYYRHQARSLSHYENFRPYHESSYRFVEPTSVTPFTHQVRTRALHAALVIALRHGCDALTANAKAGRFDKDDSRVVAVLDALKKRCRRADAGLAEDTARHLDRLVDQWQDEALRCAREKRQMHYEAKDNAADSLLRQFGDARRPGRWRTLNSMRNIEDTGVLRHDR